MRKTKVGDSNGMASQGATYFEALESWDKSLSLCAFNFFNSFNLGINLANLDYVHSHRQITPLV